MHNIQIGSIVLNGQLILYLSFGVAGWLLLRYYLRKEKEASTILSVVSNAFWLWIIVWKVSILILHPFEVFQRPAALLYFDGGVRGGWIATIASIAYIWLKAKRMNISLSIWADIWTVFLLAGWSVYQVLLFILGEEPAWFYGASAILSAVLLAILLLSSRGSDFSKGAVYAVWFSIGHVILWFGVPDRPIWLLSFSKQQLFFLLIAVCLTGWSWLKESKRKGGSHG